jgi:hypothetical protein
MSKIRNTSAGSNYQRLPDGSAELPFSALDVDGSGRLSRAEVQVALKRLFPALNDAQARTVTEDAFKALGSANLAMDRTGWGIVERTVVEGARTFEMLNGTAGEAAGGWTSEGAARPHAPAVGQTPIPLPPAPAAAGQGQYVRQPEGTYQRQIPEPQPEQKKQGNLSKGLWGTAQAVFGWAKLVPGLGQVLNAGHAVVDLGRGLFTWFNPNKSFDEKRKLAADLLFHSAGAAIPWVGAVYDMGVGGFRAGKAGYDAITGPKKDEANWSLPGKAPASPQSLPPFQFNNGGIDPVSQMLYAQQYANNPFMQGQFAQGGNAVQGAQGQAKDKYPGNSKYGTPADSGAAMGRTMFGMAQLTAAFAFPPAAMLMSAGNAVYDVWRVVSGKRDQSWLKTGADLLFHTAGAIIPGVGGAYDLAQGGWRSMKAGFGFGFGMPFGPMAPVPPDFRFAGGGYPTMFPGMAF